MESQTDESALAEALHWLMPLHYFYEKQGLPLPDFQFMPGSQVPYPYRSMLVHTNDMTPTLAAFHHSKLYLDVIQHEQTENYLLRFVILRTASSDLPVEFGAIGIRLDLFDAEVRAAIEECRMPLGGILGEYEVPHTGHPAAYFSVPADEAMADALVQPVGTRLYGRCNQLLDPDGLVLADIVEILPKSNESERWVGGTNKSG